MDQHSDYSFFGAPVADAPCAPGTVGSTAGAAPAWTPPPVGPSRGYGMTVGDLDFIARQPEEVRAMFEKVMGTEHEAELERADESGYERGFETGKQEGLDEARDEVEAEYETKVTRLEEKVSDLEDDLTEVREALSAAKGELVEANDVIASVRDELTESESTIVALRRQVEDLGGNPDERMAA